MVCDVCPLVARIQRLHQRVAARVIRRRQVDKRSVTESKEMYNCRHHHLETDQEVLQDPAEGHLVLVGEVAECVCNCAKLDQQPDRHALARLECTD